MVSLIKQSFHSYQRRTEDNFYFFGSQEGALEKRLSKQTQAGSLCRTLHLIGFFKEETLVIIANRSFPTEIYSCMLRNLHFSFAWAFPTRFWVRGKAGLIMHLWDGFVKKPYHKQVVRKPRWRQHALLCSAHPACWVWLGSPPSTFCGTGNRSPPGEPPLASFAEMHQVLKAVTVTVSFAASGPRSSSQWTTEKQHDVSLPSHLQPERL